ncbi:MAG: zinc-dependent metalloprotease [Ferruginibacter sp.]
MKNFTQKLIGLLLILLPAVIVAQVPKLNSYNTALATIYIDFDGETVNSAYWNNGNTLVCEAAPLTTAQMTEIFNRVAEDYRPFNVNITTDLARFTAAPSDMRIRIIVTPTSAWRTGVGGISYTGSFTWGDDTPGFVFSDRLGSNKIIAECISHESGHTVGLSHQSRYSSSCVLTETYNTGDGSGETSWAPIMGNSYGRNMTGWNNGPTPYGCANTQDNLTIITTQNGFSYRTDDHSDAINSTATSINSTSFNVEGVIATAADKDAFKMDITTSGAIHVEAKPYMVGSGYNTGANLDVQLQLYNGSTLISTYNPASSMSVIVDTTLQVGTYYIVVSGAGNEYTSDYGSLGSYTLTGYRGVLPIHNISLSGSVNKSKHNLSWSIIADEPVQTQELQVSTDARNYTALSTINASRNSFEYVTNQNNVVYYRLKVTTVIGETAYSNTVALKSEGAVKAFNVSTFVQQEITVNANENFNYRLLDINGRTIATGNGQMGMNRINLTNRASGMYVLQLLGASAKQSERIIKQ